MRIPFINSLMAFNKRVLYNGNIDADKMYKMEELKERINFNSIFMNNVDEMFSKYDCTTVINEYIDLLRQYVRNMCNTISCTRKVDPTVVISKKDSFERRLITYNHVSNNIITSVFPADKSIEYRFVNGGIYYLSIAEIAQREFIMISFIDPKRAIYDDILMCGFEKHSVYWRTVDCIKAHIQKEYNTIDTIAVRITKSVKDDNVTKVEYSGLFGSKEALRRIMCIFPKSALIVSNPFIYIDDIKRMIDSKIIPTKPVQKAKFRYMNLDEIFKKDILIEYPKDSFDNYLQFLSLASKNRNVKAIYTALYRIGNNPAMFYILRDAVTHGISVHVNIELFASGERINKMWLQEMKSAGIHVTTYEAGNVKVHTKLSLVEFINGKSIAQIGTGNYHTETTSQYTDLSLLTADDEICQWVRKIFNVFNGDTQAKFDDDVIMVTRHNARRKLTQLIDAEAQKGSKGYISIKCNALDDNDIISRLDEAANKGCEMDLIIRGVCTWVPDKNNVRIRSIVWDKLEHSRVYCFGRENPRIFIGSLDIVTKKLDHRIETLVLVKDPDIVLKICKYLNKYITNTMNSWKLTGSGIYEKVR